ncbi:protein kinase domain-containing protein [Streptomyces rugosispiralis]|uniref:PQQ-binding-like beta-propeller repeat protein n=1 Tax=Streptomyces rugosispiralis TaxID=2967341 RepID=A0ABT1V801_9ACTN|nr:serine/threonine-protein kinase [Streptomyces rugosispiralis]MCQ8193525.1 PQQ-binding-like beta-propeller repeat protein [Streptomyces rugosispiralis]
MPPVHRAGTGPEAEDPEYAGQYQLEARLGSGGMGVVHLARSPSGRRLAVKVVHAGLAEDPEFRARFRQEVAAARRVSGAFTAPVVDADPEGPRPWMATLYIPGPTLAEHVKRSGPLAPDETVRLAAGLAEALRDIHRAGVVHRDLKPSNVLLAADGPKVIDFGISRPSDSELRTETGKLIGTPPFMAPEQFQRPRAVGPAADVFALGSVLVHAATGRGPFESESPYIVAYQVVHDEADLAGVPDELLPLVQRCLAKNPEDRPTPDALMTVLRAVCGPRSPVPRGPVPLVPQQRTPEPHSLPGMRWGQDEGATDTHVKAAPHDVDPDPATPGTAEPDTHVKAAPEPEPAADRPESVTSEPGARRRGIRRWALSGLAAVVLLGAGTVVALRPFDGTDSSGGGRPRISAATAEAWRPWATGPAGGKAVGSGARPAFCSYGAGALYCARHGVETARVDPDDGRVVWSRPSAAARPGDGATISAPVVAGGLVRTVSPDGERLRAVDPTTHRVRWSREVSRYQGGVYSAGGTVLLVTPDGMVTSVNGTTNKERWSHRLPGHARPVFFSYGDGRTAYAVTTAGDGSHTLVTAVDTVRGTTRWHASLSGNLTPAGSGPDGVLLLTETDTRTSTTAVVRYDPERRAARRVALSTPVSALSAVTSGDRVYVLGSDGGLVAVDTAREGSARARLWRVETSVSNASSLVAADGRVYFSAADGRLLAVDARRGEVIGETRSRGGAAGRGFLATMPAPVVADGKVFATAPDGTLFAVDGRNPAGW